MHSFAAIAAARFVDPEGYMWIVGIPICCGKIGVSTLTPKSDLASTSSGWITKSPSGLHGRRPVSLETSYQSLVIARDRLVPNPLTYYLSILLELALIST